MNPPTSQRLCLWSFAALVAFGLGAKAADSEAWTVYRELVAECETATSMEQLLPFLAKWRHERHEASDEARRKESLERTCTSTDGLEDMSLVSEEASDGATVLHLEASWNDLPMKGKVTLVREGEELKVDEWSWASGE